MAARILITGGSGLVGQQLTNKLLEQGYKVGWLTRSAKEIEKVDTYMWDIDKGEIDTNAVASADYIIHLAGEGIADKRWNKNQKAKILNSRVESARLLKQAIEDTGHKPKAFICASGIGYYGYDNGGVWLKENSRFGDDFVAKVVKEWESAVDEIGNLGIRTVKLRTGIVLSEKGGALSKMIPPVKWGVGAPLGSGHQYMSWIHIDDMCDVYIKAIQNNEMSGDYNAVSTHPVTNDEFSRTLAKVLRKPYFMPAVPAFVLKLMLGEMASLVLGSGRVSSEKLVAVGFQFNHTDLHEAMSDLLARS